MDNLFIGLFKNHCQFVIQRYVTEILMYTLKHKCLSNNESIWFWLAWVRRGQWEQASCDFKHGCNPSFTQVQMSECELCVMFHFFLWDTGVDRLHDSVITASWQGNLCTMIAQHEKCKCIQNACTHCSALSQACDQKETEVCFRNPNVIEKK